MKLLALWISLLMCCASPVAHAADTPASEASIKRLMEITNSKNMVDAMMAQMDGLMRNTMKQATNGQPLTAEQEAIMADMRTKVTALMKDELKWSTLEPVLVDVYRKSFTQQEVDGMLSFYQSPAGRAVIAKMPLVMQNSMQAMQGRMAALMPKIQQIVAQSVEKVKKLPAAKGAE
jgi:uncharacterized protein